MTNLSQNTIRRLNELLDKLNKQFHINSGGCCYVAYIIARNFDKYKIKYCLNIECSTESQFTQNSRENVMNKNVVTSATHYYLRCNNLDINCLGSVFRVISISNKFIQSEHIKGIYDNCHWNDYYNTSNNKTIKNIIYDFFRKELESTSKC